MECKLPKNKSSQNRKSRDFQKLYFLYLQRQLLLVNLTFVTLRFMSPKSCGL